MTTKFPDLGPNHRRGIQAALAHLDRLLCRVEQVAGGAEQHSVFYTEHNHLSPADRACLSKEIESIRRLLRRLKRDLGLEGEPADLAREIWGQAAAVWEVLVETEAGYLERYGATPPGLADYLDPLIETVIRHVSRISRIAWDSLISDAAPPGKALESEGYPPDGHPAVDDPAQPPRET